MTATIARRNEIEHAMGLTVLVLVISGISTFRGNDASQVATWYMVAGVILVIPATLLGGWLRMEQRLLPEKRSQVIVRVMDSLRLPIAVVASFATLVTVVFIGFFVGGIFTLALPFSLGTPALMFFFFASLVFGAFLSAVVFAKINRRERGTVTPSPRAEAHDDGG